MTDITSTKMTAAAHDYNEARASVADCHARIEAKLTEDVADGRLVPHEADVVFAEILCDETEWAFRAWRALRRVVDGDGAEWRGRDGLAERVAEQAKEDR